MSQELYAVYKAECEANGWFVLNYMNWNASKKYEENKEKFQAHFVKLAEKEKEEKEKRGGKGLAETPA